MLARVALELIDDLPTQLLRQQLLDVEDRLGRRENFHAANATDDTSPRTPTAAHLAGAAKAPAQGSTCAQGSAPARMSVAVRSRVERRIGPVASAYRCRHHPAIESPCR